MAMLQVQGWVHRGLSQGDGAVGERCWQAGYCCLWWSSGCGVVEEVLIELQQEWSCYGCDNG